MNYDDLGGTGIPAVYAVAIGNDCSVCSAMMGEFCTENGYPRKRPHGSRMVVRTGESDEKMERS